MAENSNNGVPETADWAEFRRQMPVARRWAYFDHAAVAPLSGPTRTAMQEWLDDATQNGDANYLDWIGRVERLRDNAARMISATPEEIGLIRNTTEGINLVAEGFDWQPGDNVVIRADEFPANQYPWLHLADRGVETRRVATEEDGRFDPDRLAAACDDRTRILSISWVAFADGWRHDVDRLARIAHDCGALLLLDAIQGLGVFPLDVSQTPVDFLAADGHKWMLGPEGAGIFYLRREHLDRLRPTGVGWNSVVRPHDFSHIELRLKDTAARYEGGSPNMGGLIGLGASLDLLGRFPVEAIGRRIVELTDFACERLQQIGAILHSDRRPEHKSGIVTFELPGRDPNEARRRCLERQVVLSCRGGRLRISPHAYNDASDIDRLIEALT
ncbi:MAG: aminotransferase class V-fold PLP-dependent enzyme [Thermoguttaceae bacterium]